MTNAHTFSSKKNLLPLFRSETCFQRSRFAALRWQGRRLSNTNLLCGLPWVKGTARARPPILTHFVQTLPAPVVAVVVSPLCCDLVPPSPNIRNHGSPLPWIEGVV